MREKQKDGMLLSLAQRLLDCDLLPHERSTIEKAITEEGKLTEYQRWCIISFAALYAEEVSL